MLYKRSYSFVLRKWGEVLIEWQLLNDAASWSQVTINKRAADNQNMTKIICYLFQGSLLTAE